MKIKNFLLEILFLLPLLFLSCEEDNTPPYLYLDIAGELPYCNTLLEDTVLIGNDEIKSLVLNSEAEVKQNFTPHFLSVYPEYVKVDFKQYSVLVITAVIQGKVIGRNAKYYKATNAPLYYCAYTYEVDSSDRKFYKERTAVVVEKLKANETVELLYSM